MEKRKRKFEKQKETREVDITNIETYSQAKTIGKILRSEVLIKILNLANGTKSISEISKKIGKELSNTSKYVKYLKDNGFFF